MAKVHAEPYVYPLVGELSPACTALLVIDMQVDFCGAGGYMDRMGFDLDFLRGPIAPIRRLQDAFRRYGFPIIHTRETLPPISPTSSRTACGARRAASPWAIPVRLAAA
jgi:nicotinamidase-related amidase